MAKAYLAPYGVGLGHASRLISISEHLKQDNTTIKFSSFGEAVSYINNHGYECLSVPQDIHYYCHIFKFELETKKNT